MSGAAAIRPGEASFARDDAATRDHFDALARAHGGSVKAVDWGSRASQELRFEVLSSIGNLHGARVLDVGCGQGDLAAWLAQRGVACDYHGIDLSPAMIELARARQPGRSFELRNLLDDDFTLWTRRFDFVIASGIFYLRRHAAADYQRAMIERMFALCTRGLAFNSLSAWDTRPNDALEYRADPMLTLAMATRLTERLSLRHDYHPGDFSILLWREERA